MIRIKVLDRSLVINIDERIVAESVEEYPIKFEFSEAWEGYSCSAVFQLNNDVPEERVIVGNQCMLPCFKVGRLRIGIYGIKGNSIRPTIWGSIQNVYDGPDTDNIEPPPEDPTPWNEAVEEMGRIGREAAASATSANNSAVAAHNSAMSAEQSAEDAEDAAQKAEEASTHSPIIGDNGNWYIWDIDTGAYVDTGYHAQGLDRPQINDVTPTTTNPYSGARVEARLQTKQDTISDLSTIRSGAAKGATAYQKPSAGVPKSDLSSEIKTSLDKADTALQSYTETDPTVPSWAKQPNKPTYTATEVGAMPASENTGTVNQVFTKTATGGKWADASTGTIDHRDLTNRDAANQHPISAITGLAEKFDAVDADVEALQTDVTNIETDVDNLQTAVTNIDAEVDSLQTAVTNIETDIGTLRTDVADLETAVDGKQPMIEDLDEIRAGAEAGATALQGTDDTLSIEGEAADAAAVGAELKKITPYVDKRKVKDYLHEIWYEKLDYEAAYDYFEQDADVVLGSCSTIRNGNLFARNFDWAYSEEAEFIVYTSSFAGHYASVGVAGGASVLTDEFVTSGEPSDMYKIIPFMTRDGMNEYGVAVSMNVVPTDNGENRAVPTGSVQATVCGIMLPRYVLDHFKTAHEAVQFIQQHMVIYFTRRLHDMDYEIHYMIADKSHTYLVEIIDDAAVVTEMDAPYMTNFYLDGVTLNADGTVCTPASGDAINTNHITEHGSGLERYNIIANNYNFAGTKAGMRNLLNSLKYTRAYSTSPDFASPRWDTEFVGGNLKVNSASSAFDSIVATAGQKFATRTRNGETWHTMHSTIYDIANGKMYLIVQEDGEEVERDAVISQETIIDLIDSKQDIISDLADIRSGASAGATAIQTETDPTVPDWAKQISKPSYSASEISYGSENVDSALDNKLNGAIGEEVPTGMKNALFLDTDDETIDPAVRWDVSQTLTSANKNTARANIDAVSQAELSSGLSAKADLTQVVRHDTVQTLTETQRETARKNINCLSNENFALIKTVTADGQATSYVIDKDSDDNPFSLRSVVMILNCKAPDENITMYFADRTRGTGHDIRIGQATISTGSDRAIIGYAYVMGGRLFGLMSYAFGSYAPSEESGSIANVASGGVGAYGRSTCDAITSVVVAGKFPLDSKIYIYGMK